MTHRITFLHLMLFLALPLIAGCASLPEMKSIESFSTALKADDLEALKSSTSAGFEQKALRLTGALDDFKILHLPSGEISVVKVDDISEDEKRVTVEVGKKKRRLLYRLTRGKGDKTWVVDDIIVKQKQKGLSAAKSVTEQMDLLLSVREFLSAWKSGEKAEILETTSPQLGSRLGDLPPSLLAWLTTKVAAPKSRGSKKPEAQMDEAVAVVRLPRDSGELILSFKLLPDGWKVDDLAAESKHDGDHIPSLSKMAVVMATTVSFLDAYSQGDSKRLSQVCERKLFKQSLAHADLTAVRLPVSKELAGNFQIKMQEHRADFIISSQEEVVKITLLGLGGKNGESTSAEYKVEDVAIYDLKSNEEKRLSTVFTAHAMMRIFGIALSKRDLTVLRKTATTDFNNRVWNKIDPASIGEFSLPDTKGAVATILSTSFRGAVIEITVTYGQQPMTYILRDRAGQVAIDDVLIPASRMPSSLKEHLELIIPVKKFAASIASSKIESIQRHSSEDFNRMVWKQIDKLPAMAFAVPRYLNAPLTSIRQTDEGIVIFFGDEQFGAKVLLIEEHTHYVIDDILLIAGLEPHERARLKHEMRIRIAEGPRRTSMPTQPNLQQPPVSALPNNRQSPTVNAAEDSLLQSLPEAASTFEPADDAFSTPATTTADDPFRGVDELPSR